uniref:Uncharacterized protein n=1 Tax=Chromera velia CCMP2878 TaxID=1169474 RepID=A0A0G4HG67_9ALVE|eukprot:Cvel_27266.t1-p1 / transcript=Cvel_27266.t1 / gene=Cvel_27266 / organism=Chromera_velia_CCMP2878 / gene_product=hypothetical protein / transcript_product=hypothetical protein / location=Cvel_scaffold3376:11864-12142(-) / protein_length=93 / sequence_SO=supercontig / SO=protein_coding / is_pseudo=false
MDDHIHEITFTARPAPTRFASANLFGSPPSSRPPRGRPLVGRRILFPPPILSVVGPEWWVYDHKGDDEAMQAFVSSSSKRWIRTSDDGWMKRD